MSLLSVCNATQVSSSAYVNPVVAVIGVLSIKTFNFFWQLIGLVIIFAVCFINKQGE